MPLSNSLSLFCQTITGEVVHKTRNGKCPRMTLTSMSKTYNNNSYFAFFLYRSSSPPLLLMRVEVTTNATTAIASFSSLPLLLTRVEVTTNATTKVECCSASPAPNLQPGTNWPKKFTLTARSMVSQKAFKKSIEQEVGKRKRKCHEKCVHSLVVIVA
jgi:hypothetical protein